ncbi:MAG: hypothetical protein WBO10_00475 [Pyrinomonadaceae bacterium]
MKGFNWQMVAGFLLSIFAFISYPLIFARFSMTPGFLWLSVGISILAIILAIWGFRRGFGSGRGTWSKIAASVFTLLTVSVFGVFVFAAFVLSTSVPKSAGAPAVGRSAPDFALLDTKGKPVVLTNVLANQKGVLLVFYRGHW